jgi:hypothetical protein
LQLKNSINVQKGLGYYFKIIVCTRGDLILIMLGVLFIHTALAVMHVGLKDQVLLIGSCGTPRTSISALSFANPLSALGSFWRPSFSSRVSDLLRMPVVRELYEEEFVFKSPAKEEKILEQEPKI